MVRTTLLLKIVLVGILILTSAGSADRAAAQDTAGSGKGWSPRSLPFDGLSCPLSLTHPLPVVESLKSHLSNARRWSRCIESTNGLGWQHQEGWLATNTPCSWYGVSCEAGHVRSINLQDNQLSGNIPPELDYLANLRGLDLSRQPTDGSIPSDWVTSLTYRPFTLPQPTERQHPAPVGQPGQPADLGCPLTN